MVFTPTPEDALLPIKTTVEDIDALAGFLKSQIGWTSIEKVKRTIDSKVVDNRKLEAYRRLGLLERDGANIMLTETGRQFSSGADGRKAAMAEGLRNFTLYRETVDWFHWSKVQNPSKSTVGNYWHSSRSSELEGAQGAALGDAVILFLRVCDAAGLGKFTRGTKGSPDTYLKSDASAIESFVETAPTEPSTGENDGGNVADTAVTAATVDPPPTTAESQVTGSARQGLDVTTSPSVHVNVEIHIAADATAETVAEIFKNMRKYVLNSPALNDGE